MDDVGQKHRAGFPKMSVHAPSKESFTKLLSPPLHCLTMKVSRNDNETTKKEKLIVIEAYANRLLELKEPTTRNLDLSVRSSAR